LAAFDVIFAVCRSAGYTENDLRCVAGIAEDVAFPTTNFFGDLVGLIGTNPSGHPLTVTINSIVNSLYMRYAYYLLNPKKECRTFKKYVHLITYGDDNICGISKKVPWFNHTSISSILGDIGVGYTMADKEEASVPYISICDATFLKRYWKYSAETDTQLAAIEKSSMYNALTVSIPSRVVSREYQCIDIMHSVLSLAFQHGKKFYEHLRGVLETVIERAQLQPEIELKPLPTFDDLMARYDDTRQ